MPCIKPPIGVARSNGRLYSGIADFRSTLHSSSDAGYGRRLRFEGVPERRVVFFDGKFPLPEQRASGAALEGGAIRTTSILQSSKPANDFGSSTAPRVWHPRPEYHCENSARLRREITIRPTGAGF